MESYNSKSYIFNVVLMALILLVSRSVFSVENVTYYHNDNLGSPVAATDGGGNVIWRESYQPFGTREQHQGDAKNTLWFTGKQEENFLGLSYFGARWYDPEMGRFLAMDPVGVSPVNPHSFNRYAYANNNPYRFVDPNGLRPVTDGEVRDVLRPVFNNTINYESIDIQSGANGDVRAMLPLATNNAVTLESTIHFPSKAYKDDFSKGDMASKSWFIHEASHVWQYQNNENYSWVSAAADRRYTYTFFGSDRGVLDYGWEQQASIITDAYLVSRGYKPQKLSSPTANVSDLELNRNYDSLIRPHGLGPLQECRP